jgi:hypothetical protein
MLNVRKLAAIDLAFLGSKTIPTEFALGVAGSTSLGILTLRGHPPLSLGANDRLGRVLAEFGD